MTIQTKTTFGANRPIWPAEEKAAVDFIAAHAGDNIDSSTLPEYIIIDWEDEDTANKWIALTSKFFPPVTTVIL
jgi:hypothetical protein